MPGRRADHERPSTLLEQIGRTKTSFTRLAGAHVGLLKAEIGDIVNQLKVVGTLAGIALGLAILVGNMLYIGGFLFLGEWLFGSIGWGLAHGVLFGLALIVMVVLAILGAPLSRAIVGFVIAALAAAAIAILLGLNIAHDTSSYVAGQLAAPLDSPGLVALLGGAVIGGLLFMLMFAAAAALRGAVAGLFVGAIVGALVGWLMGGAPWTWPPAAGFAITLGLLLWPILALALAAPGLDPGARFARLYPRQSIDAANETKAWLEEQWQTRQPKLGKK